MCKPSYDILSPLRQFPDVVTPFERVDDDFIGPLTIALDDVKYILTVVDVLTHFLVAVPISSKEIFITHILSIHGAPRQGISDRGGEFMNEMFKRVLEIGNIKHNISPVEQRSSREGKWDHH
ncbi:uncharacterized protein LOC143037296 [Oratosquilla oratoria]|uniref:uncharacterized protein LOC143037296 n=1 Tax=Oratosquilla oratoria TaxID=337810 RepID=UPI003F75A22A